MALPSPFHALPVRGALAALAGAALLITGCQQQPSAELQRLQQSQEQLELKIQQLEQKLNAASPGNGADPAGKPPAGAIKSLTYRSGTADDRLRIYWADGSKTDLPCTKEQSTLVCG
jgi:outer membrane murein-binding lipoprotein Lpp